MTRPSASAPGFGRRGTSGHRTIEVARGLWGLLCLIGPGFVLAHTGGDMRDGRSRRVMRILGARQLSQACLSGVSPTGPVLAMGVWVDAVHAGTAVCLAAVDHRYVKPALTDAVIAGCWAGTGWHDLSGIAADGGERRRSQLATAVLQRLPGGRGLLARAGSH